MLDYRQAVIFSIALLLSATHLASPAEASAQGRWIATSTASLAITGDITLKGNTLTFGNGSKLALTSLGEQVGRWSPTGGTGPGTVYKLIPPSDPVLLHGNRLCGMPEPVTHLVIAHSSQRSLSLTVFVGKDAPQGFGDQSCAVYFYER